MVEYIDKEEVLKIIYDIKENKEIPKNYGTLLDIIRLVRNIPTADVVEVKQIEIIRDDLKWWLETNTEKGVVHIPKFVVENMIAKMDGGKAE